jgi:hypothetical protein
VDKDKTSKMPADRQKAQDKKIKKTDDVGSAILPLPRSAAHQ